MRVWSALVLVLVSALAGAGCHDYLDEEVLADDDAQVGPPWTDTEPLSLQTPLVLAPVFDRQLQTALAVRTTRRLFRTAEAFRKTFGHDAPGVDFTGAEWVVVYAAGDVPAAARAQVQAVRFSSD